MKVPQSAKGGTTRMIIRITPLIDCFFLLMVFFLLTIRFQVPEGVLENRLPQKSETGIHKQQQNWEVVRIRILLVISAEKQPRIYLQDRALFSYEELRDCLNKLPADIQLAIEPDPSVPYKYFIGVYNTCVKAGKKNIIFSVKPGVNQAIP